MQEHYKNVKRVLWIILFANIGVALTKIILGTLIKSASMTADGYHSLADGSSNIVGIIGIRLASKPVDEDHPYGHKKFETLAGLFIAGMLFFIGGKVIYDGIIGFMHPIAPSITWESLIALIMTLGINIFVATYEYRKGKDLNSSILISDSMHTRSDIYVSVGVLVTLLGVRLGLPPMIDSISSLVVAGFIIRAAYEIFKDNSEVLVDAAVVNTDKIEAIARSFQQVKDVHKIRSRGTSSEPHIDMHIKVVPQTSVLDSHTLMHNIEDAIRVNIHKNAQVIVHIEPYTDEIKNEEDEKK